MRILIFHGYLLRGTGSNVYNAQLAQALVGLGHEVHLLCQDRSAAELGFVDAVGRFEHGELRVATVREPVRLTAYLPDIGQTLPVYVADAYAGFDARTFADLPDSAIESYLRANVEATAEVARTVGPQVALANHLVMGPVVLARALGGAVPYAVKVHGSALEYTVRPHPERFLPPAREGLEGAGGVLVGSSHTASSLFELMADPALERKTRLGPPGVDGTRFHPCPPPGAVTRLAALARRLEHRTAEWGGEAGAVAAVRSLDPAREAIITYVGKLIVSKGVDLLAAAWPLVAARFPEARLCIVGFGGYREALGKLVNALSEGDLGAARAIAARGRELEGGPPGELAYLAAFLARVESGEYPGYLDSARAAMTRLHFTGRLEHEDLPDLLSGSLAQVVPSTFPEAFGMVAVEGAACGALPISAAHSGLAEVSSSLAPVLDPEIRPLLSFERGSHAIDQLAQRISAWLSLEPALRDRARAALSSRALDLYGWDRVGRGVIAAAQGQLDGLPSPGTGAAPCRRQSG
ncbi:MAG: hypothetical protein NVSMB25_08050 [Thermoleophilaceae bacterium]